MEEQKSNNLIISEKLINHPTLTVSDIQKSSIPELTKKVIIASQNFPKIRTLDEKVSRDYLIDLLAAVIWESGHNIEADEQKILINYMIEEIKNDFSNLTLEEVKIALKKGLRGYYGQVFGMNVKMMYSWLESYVSETKAESLKYLTIIEKKEPEEKSDDHKRYLHFEWLKLCINAYEEYKETGKTSFVDAKNNLYDYIRYKLKLADLTKEEVDNIWQYAVLEYKSNHSIEKSKNKYELIDFRLLIKKFQDGDSTEQEKVKFIARKIALNKLFEKIKGANIDFRKVVIDFENKINSI